MQIKIECKLERAATGSVLHTGIAFDARKDETRDDQLRALESIVDYNFPGWRIAAVEFV